MTTPLPVLRRNIAPVPRIPDDSDAMTGVRILRSYMQELANQILAGALVGPEDLPGATPPLRLNSTTGLLEITPPTAANTLLVATASAWQEADAPAASPIGLNGDKKITLLPGSAADQAWVWTGAAWALTPLRYQRQFTDSDLSGGALTVTHNLARRPAGVLVWNDANAVATPDSVTYTNSNTITIDLTTLAPLTGTWIVTVA